MYDRRVVRGNTFAALVIPVSMQADQGSQERQYPTRQAPKHQQLKQVRRISVKTEI